MNKQIIQPKQILQTFFEHWAFLKVFDESISRLSGKIPQRVDAPAEAQVEIDAGDPITIFVVSDREEDQV